MILGGVILSLVSNVGQQSDLTSTLDSAGQVTLVSCASAGGTAGQNLAALGQITADLGSIKIQNCQSLFETPFLIQNYYYLRQIQY